MKIDPLLGMFKIFDRQAVAEKKDKAYGDGHQNQGEFQSKRDQKDEVPVTDESVSEAIDAFSRDKKAISSGLSAVALGAGPDLQVVLKDRSGKIIRQLTGSEFIKLREAVQTGTKPRGGILDQKL